jgi:glycosidase
MGFKVVMDMVPNHSGADHEWLRTHPDFYTLDSNTGKPLAPFDWSDVRELNYDNPHLRDSIKETFRYWLRETDIDGFRVDVAWGVPDDFWSSTLSELRKMKPDLFLLAEAEGPNFHRDGFDASYPWKIFHGMNKVASGKSNLLALDSLLKEQDTLYPKNALHLYFTSNHDENSWNKADYGTMPGIIHAPFAVFTQTYAQSIPLIYSGQEEPILEAIPFFYKDTLTFRQLGREKFYQTLLQLRQQNPALSALAPLTRIQAGDPKAILAYTRNAKENAVLVILNLSPSKQTLSLPAELGGIKAFAIFQNQETQLPSRPFEMDPWGYQVFTYSTPK